MNTQRWERLVGLFEQAIELDSEERRQLYARDCADDPALGDEVERMIAADAGQLGFLDADAPVAPPKLPTSGARVGGYTLIRRVASGGMGVVFEALQEGTGRRVAIKLVHAGSADEATLRRFRYEAQALGRLRHPGIAQVYEAGVDVDASGTDRPFLAMELVEGARAATTFVREEGLPIEGVVRLFVEICRAVQHGHARGVLHRDLKPSNVLVDASGSPKVIDFGIARVLDAQQTRATDAGEIVGTLAAMSPEQLEGDPDAVDVRSDVYALGALLYEMLCGAPPVDLRGLSLADALDKARQSEPVRPSRLRADLPQELDWIVLRALEPERERRYSTAAELAADLERHLSDEPVLASPPSRVYRVRKFVRRNRALVGGLLAIFAVVVVGAIVALVERDRAIAAKVRAEKAEKVAEAAEALAEERLARIEVEARSNRELVRFQGRILGSADPDTGGRDVRVVDALAEASLDLDAQTFTDPRLWLTLRRSIVEAYTALGLAREARRELDRMRPVWEAQFAPEERERLVLERIALEVDDNFVPAAEVWTRAQAGLERATAALGATDEETARWQVVAGSAASKVGRIDEGQSLHERALATLSNSLGGGAPEVIDLQLEQSAALSDSRSLREAEASARAAFDAARAGLGADHKLTLQAQGRVAWTTGINGRVADALEILDEIVAAHVRRTGPSSLPALRARFDRTMLLREALRPAEALAELESVIDVAVAEYGDHQAFVHRARYWRAYTLVGLGRVPEALAAFEQAYEASRSSQGADDPLTIEILSQYAFNLFRLGRHADALPRAREAWQRSLHVLGEENAVTLARANGYAVILASLGRRKEAVEVLDWLLVVQERRLGEQHGDTLVTLKNLTMIRLDVGDPEGALCSALELVRRADGDPNPLRAAGAHWALGNVLDRLERPHLAALHLCIASDRWAISSAAGTEIAIFGLMDEARVQGTIGHGTQMLQLLERAVAMACGPGLSPSIRSRALTQLAEGRLASGDQAAARALAEMVVEGTDETEPKVRERAERILEAG